MAQIRVCDDHKEAVIARKLYYIRGFEPIYGNRVGGYLIPQQIKDGAPCQVCGSPHRFIDERHQRLDQ